MTDDARFLIVKRGLYFRPNDAGYTGIKEYAGRYPEGHASAKCGETAIHEDAAPMFAPECFDDIAREYLLTRIEQLRKALETVLPRGVCLTNRNVPDSTVVPLETTMGDLRNLAALIQSGER